MASKAVRLGLTEYLAFIGSRDTGFSEFRLLWFEKLEIWQMARVDCAITFMPYAIFHTVCPTLPGMTGTHLPTSELV